MSSLQVSRANLLGLYRDLLRASKTMPTETKRDWVSRRTRREFRKYKNETDQETIDLQIRLGMTQLDTVRTQAEHLRKIEEGDFSTPPQEGEEERQQTRMPSLADQIYG